MYYCKPPSASLNFPNLVSADEQLHAIISSNKFVVCASAYDMRFMNHSRIHRPSMTRSKSI